MRVNLSFGLNFASTRRTTYCNMGTKEVYARPYYTFDEDYLSFRKGENPCCDEVRIVCSNFSDFFRKDIPDWNFFAQSVNNAFLDAQKVNVYDFGCSDGSEAYSLIISLIELLGEKEAQKFFPIKAYDNDERIIEIAKSGSIECTKSEKDVINEQTDNNFYKYFDIIDCVEDSRFLVEPKEILSKNVEFQQGDFVCGIDKIKGDNNLILCRNFWKYLKESDRQTAIAKMKNLKQPSKIVIGKFDKEFSQGILPVYFYYFGFCENGFFYEKRKSPKMFELRGI